MKRMLALAMLIGIGGAFLGMSLAPGMRAVVGPALLRIAWRPATVGITVLVLPPLGEVSARTHRVPGRLEVTLEQIRLDALRRVIDEAQDDRSEATQNLIRQSQAALTAYSAWLLGAALIGTVSLWFGGSLLVRRPPRAAPFALSLLVAASAAAGLSGATRYTYDPQGFQRPVYRGALEEMPWLVELVDDGLVKVTQLDQRLRGLAQNVYRMYRRVESFRPHPALEDADVIVLHVSDIHNHPSAANIALEVAHAFGADFVVNTRDLSDFGTLLEAELTLGIAAIGLPHYFVSGNHESPSFLRFVETLDSVALIDGKQIAAMGLRIAGLGDPSAYRESPAAMTPAEALEQAAILNERLASSSDAIDILAVHNHRVGQAITPGRVPAVLFGHNHVASVRFDGGTVYVNAGTTGGAGLRGIEADQSVPITLAVLYFRRLPERDGGDAAPDEEAAPILPGHFRSYVVAVDLLTFSPFGGGFRLERHLAPTS